MWVLVHFDLPTNTKKERKDAAKFRKQLLEDGFEMFQYSVYVRHCTSRENAAVHELRVEGFLPPSGHVSILTITDKQFGSMKHFYGTKPASKDPGVVQLELF